MAKAWIEIPDQHNAEIQDLVTRASNMANSAHYLTDRDIHDLAASFAKELEKIFLESRAQKQKPARVIEMAKWRQARKDAA